MEEVIPERLMSTERRDDFLAWLRALRIDPEDKRELLLYWCDRVQVKTIGYMLEWAGIK